MPTIDTRPHRTHRLPGHRFRYLLPALGCLGLFGAGVLVGRHADGAASLGPQLQAARGLGRQLGLTRTHLSAEGQWGVMRPGVGAPPVDADQLAEIKRLQSLGYVGGSRPPSAASGATINVHGMAAPGLRFYVTGDEPGALLIDLDGRPQHRWRYSYQRCLADADAGAFLPDREGVTACWRRARLLPDGGVLAIFEGHGLVRLDRDSNLLWAFPRACHHDLDLAPDGSLYVLTREARVVPRFHPRKPVLVDFITHVSAEGHELESIDLLAAFENSVYASCLQFAREAGDIFHTNTLELLDGSLADKSPIFAAGNFLISLRELNIVAIIDPGRQRVVWALAGMWSGQHQPTLLPSGNLLVFDNKGHDGRSKVLEIEPLSQQVVWSYAGGDETPLFSATCGSVQRLANGNTLITESDNGRALEVTAAGQVVWEFRNPARTGPDRQYIAAIMEMTAEPAPGWLGGRP